MPAPAAAAPTGTTALALNASSHPRAETIPKLLAWCKKTSPTFMIKDSLVGFKTLPDGNVTAVALKEIPADTVRRPLPTHPPTPLRVVKACTNTVI